MKLALAVMGLVGLVGTGCASSPAAAPLGRLVAEATPSVMSDATPARSTTLALGLGASAAEGRTEEARAVEPAPLPTACGAEGTLKDTKLCMPERGYANKLCGGIYPEVALGLFAKGTPFTRIYLAGDIEAWNASGGRTHRAKLAFDEEVLVLGKHGAAASGGIVMTGAQASFDVLRWDGTCVSVMEGEITTRRPPAPKPADLSFGRLEETTRRALLATPKVKATYDARGLACGAVSSTNATAAEQRACDKADKAFSRAIVDAVRSGAMLPAPGRRP